ncbi:hypothetical protein N7530_008541 [Penicillium desertorum]|uniref:F-box domain-containing protein n=1 Tax=Penicillium desertorum TaxID=1303715 RepID=A0A9W9WPC6_9EURO|nr:hypothetical protein N7530_008541 [Penicillium desertorum]
MAYTSLPALPFELWGCVTSHLSNTDIKSLRLACNQFNNAVSLCLNRVFLSANPLNIEVFRNIALHDKFRHLVTEIIWDEARLPRGPQRTPETDEGQELLSDEDKHDNSREWAKKYHTRYREEIIERHKYKEENGCPKWFKDACEGNLYILRDRKDRDLDRPDYIERREQVFAQPPLRERWQHYRYLLRLQKDVLADKSHLEAFLFGVKQFPTLKRVTITPTAHGNLFAPLYPTPMIRAFPKGFNYPIPRINYTIFDEPCEEYDYFATVLKNKGFRRLDIGLLVNGELKQDIEAYWRSLVNRRLRRALSETKEIEEFRLHTTFIEELYNDGEYPLIPLHSIVPVEKWSNLRHFELSGFVISQADCISFLNTLPKSVRSIELSMLRFLDDSNWYSMLEDMRRMGDRDATSRPKITIGVPISNSSPKDGIGRWIEKEVRDFVYGGGETPFEEDFPLDIPYGVGVLKDAFEPNFERPNVDPETLIELNICKEHYDPNEY